MTGLLRAGDGVILLAGGALVAALTAHGWNPRVGEAVVIRAGGVVYAPLPLTRDRQIDVPGALGVSRVEIRAGRVRVASDPSPRQLCVRQGWLANAGEAALCLPNQISVEITGSGSGHDTRVY